MVINTCKSTDFFKVLRILYRCLELLEAILKGLVSLLFSAKSVDQL